MLRSTTRPLFIRISQLSICLVLTWPTFLINTKEAPGKRSENLASNRLLRRTQTDNTHPHPGTTCHSVSQAPHHLKCQDVRLERTDVAAVEGTEQGVRSLSTPEPVLLSCLGNERSEPRQAPVQQPLLQRKDRMALGRAIPLE